MAIERTVVVIKPDAVYKRLETHIIQRYTDANLTILSRSKRKWTQDKAREFYGIHAGRDFYAGLVLAMSSGVSIALLLEGENAVAKVRELNGATDPREAAAGTIRGDFKSAGGPFNIVHGSDSVEAAAREMALIHEWDEILSNIPDAN